MRNDSFQEKSFQHSTETATTITTHSLGNGPLSTITQVSQNQKIIQQHLHLRLLHTIIKYLIEFCMVHSISLKQAV